MYAVTYSKIADKELQKLDKRIASVIYSWIDKHLEGCENPRLHGKALVGDKRGYWRYRIGAYRVIADIRDEIIQIEIIHVAHRREVYS
jgi:mRNA interferase RelE/StbE